MTSSQLALLFALALSGVAHADAPPAAKSLTERARNAARDGRCDNLAAIGAQIRVLDADYYATVFATDPTIALCGAVDPQRFAPPSTVQVHSAPVDLERLNPSTAAALSVVGTLGGLALTVFGSQNSSMRTPMVLLGLAGIAIGPTLGHIYSHHTWNLGLGMRLAGLAAGVIGAALMLQCIDGCSAGGSTRDQADLGVALFMVGGSSYVVGTIYEIATAPGAADDYNRDHGVALTLAPLRGRDGMVPGVGLLGHF